MEVGNQGIHHLKRKSRIDENICPAGLSFYFSTFSCGGLQGSAGSRSGTDDSSPSFFAGFYLLRHLLGNGIIFRMHVMLLHFLHFHRPEGTKAYMKGDAKNLNPLSLTLLQ